MSLFPVPGWSMTSNPIPTSKPVSKKRKRPSTNPDKLQSAEINLEKLVKKLKNDSTTLIDGREARDKTLPKNRKTKRSQETKNRTEIDRSKPASPKEEHSEKNRTRTPSTTLAKRKSRKLQDEASVAEPQGAISGLTSLQQTMKQSLDGARFRIINEQLYKTSSTQAHEMVRADPHVYEEYHTGFRRQVQLWPTNPVEHYIALLSTYPPRTVVADLGCGDAAVARNLIPKGITVLSFDLVSDNEYVVEADICSKVPLPGSEPSSDGSTGSAQIVDVVVCALSLMGTNWPNCLREAWRILKADGELKIAEVASRFRSIDEFQALVASIGFQLKSKDTSNSHFSLFEFKKVPCGRKSEKEWANLSSKGGILKACEYKRR
ncbi:ribosomal RNA-processing protein 8 [Infundibulicybe gibba]|nr:ribosomal RNA-processing protein 8 [Infundibulicybe gibba]